MLRTEDVPLMVLCPCLSPRVFMPRTIAKVLSLSHKNPMRYPDIFNVRLFFYPARKTQTPGYTVTCAPVKSGESGSFCRSGQRKPRFGHQMAGPAGNSRNHSLQPVSFVSYPPSFSSTARNLRDRIISTMMFTRGSCACSRLILFRARNSLSASRKMSPKSASFFVADTGHAPHLFRRRRQVARHRAQRRIGEDHVRGDVAIVGDLFA